MEDLFLQDITIYHKNGETYQRYNIRASYRNTTNLNRNSYQFSSNDNVIVRIFDKSFEDKVEIGDIIVNKKVTDNVVDAPQTELRKIYGKNNVFKVMSKNVLLFDGKVGEIEHIRLGCE